MPITPAGHPTRRRGDRLPPDHPLTGVDLPEGDCCADVPADLLDRVAAWHGLDERDTPTGDPVPPDAEVR